MNKSKIVWLLTMVSCLCACTKHDKSFDDVTPPVVEPVYAITGHVTDYQGHVLVDALIQTTEGQSVKTDKNGIYFMEMPEPESSKTYTLTASHEGKKDVSRNVSLIEQEGCVIVNQDFRLPSSTVITFIGGNEGNLNTECLDHNDFAKTLVGAYVEGHENENFQLELFYYNEHFGADSENTNLTSGTFEMDKLFFAAKVTFAEVGKRDEVLYTLFFDFDTETQDNTIIRSFSNGKWSVVPESQMIHESNRMVINSAELGVVYAAFCHTDITVTEETIPFVCNPSEVNNIYGEAPIIVPYVDITYRVGVDLNMPAHCQLEALLLEVIAREYGSISHEETYRWIFNDNSKLLGLAIAVGIAVGIIGAGICLMIETSDAGNKIAKKYGQTIVKVNPYGNEHIGGGN